MWVTTPNAIEITTLAHAPGVSFRSGATYGASRERTATGVIPMAAPRHRRTTTNARSAYGRHAGTPQTAECVVLYDGVHRKNIGRSGTIVPTDNASGLSRFKRLSGTAASACVGVKGTSVLLGAIGAQLSAIR